MSALIKRLEFYFKCVRCVYTKRAITGDHMTELNEGTLTGRLLNYLISAKPGLNTVAENTEIPNIISLSNVNDLKKYSTAQILSTLNSITNREVYKTRNEFLTVLNLLDYELCKRSDQLKTVETLNALHTYMNVIPHRIVEYKFYEKTMDKLFIKASTLPKNHLIQFIFYLGLQKKTSKSQYMLNKCIKLLNEELLNILSAEDLCIVCNSTFKTSTKINNKLLLDKVIHYLNDNLCVLKDPAFFITLIKTIRHNQYQNEELLATISYTIFFNSTIGYYPFAALCHILALYSDFLYYDDTLLRVFTEKCIHLLKTSQISSKHIYLMEQPRLKDIKRLLWSLSNLNYKYLEKENIRNNILPSITKRIENGELKNDISSLIEMCLYLWMLNYHEPQLISYGLTKENVQHINALTTPAKQRLNLLLTCIYFEDRTLYKKINIPPQPNTDYNILPQLKKRIILQRVFEMLKLIPAKFEVNKYILDCQIPHLNIVGITGYRKNIYKTVHIEILDDYTCLKNTECTPSGLMQLKLRILERLDEGIIMIHSKEVESMSDEELSNFLEDELDLVC